VYILNHPTYLDHNATTPLAPKVQRAMARCMKKCPGNPSSLHTPGRRARGMIDEARARVALLLGCDPERVLFASGGTETNNAVIKGVFDAAGGGHVVTSRIEHESVLGACVQVERLGGRVTYLPACPDGRVDPAAVEGAIAEDTILVSIMHANNETGVVQPVKEIAAICRSRGIPFHTDAVQSYGKIPTLVDEIGCEFLTLSAHKIGGPKGAGALYWRGDTKWTPLVYGGSQEMEFRAGTEGVHQIVGLGLAAELRKRGMEDEAARLAGLRVKVVDGLRRAWPDVRINECPGHQLPGTVNATFPGKDGLRLLAGLDCYEVSVSIGSACTADRIEPSHVLLGMGASEEDALATIRISMGGDTTRSKIKYFLWTLREVLKGDPEGFAYIDPKDLTEERICSPETFLIDLRFPVERMLLPTVPGAQRWSHIGFGRFIKRIPWDKEVVMMCNTGVFSLSAGYRLARAGHPRARVVFGGYQAWNAMHPGLVAKLKRRAP
jgi:cysteine desulfurase